MARIKNIKVDFTGTYYTPSSVFTLQANGGSFVDTGITYNQLTHTGPGYNMTIGPTTTEITLTSTGFGQQCYQVVNSGSFNPYPTPFTSPIMFSSTDANMRSIRRTYGITQDTGNACNDIYLLGAINGLKRLHNVTAEEYPNKGPFTSLTSSATEPYQSDLLYIPQYDAIAYSSQPTQQWPSVPVYPSPTGPSFRIVSMSGEFLFESNPTSSQAVINTTATNLQVVDDYLYVEGPVYDPGCTNSPPLPGCIRAGSFRLHLPTMTVDFDWIDNIGAVLGEPIKNLVIGSGSNNFYCINGYASRSNNRAIMCDSNGIIQYQLQARLPGNEQAGTFTSLVKNNNDEFIIGGNFSELAIFTGSAALNLVGRTPLATYTQHGIAKLNSNLDFRPFTSSFSRYTVNPFNNPVDFSTSWYGPVSLALDSNENIIAGFKGANPINSNISGSYANVSGSLAVFDSTGSMVSGWNYPVNVDLDNAQVRYVEIRRLRVQQDDSIIAILDKYSPSQPNLDLLNYDNKVVGTQMIVSQSGVVTDY